LEHTDSNNDGNRRPDPQYPASHTLVLLALSSALPSRTVFTSTQGRCNEAKPTVGRMVRSKERVR